MLESGVNVHQFLMFFNRHHICHIGDVGTYGFGQEFFRGRSRKR